MELTEFINRLATFHARIDELRMVTGCTDAQAAHLLNRAESYGLDYEVLLDYLKCGGTFAVLEETAKGNL